LVDVQSAELLRELRLLRQLVERQNELLAMLLQEVKRAGLG
jgi:hypothetical protein